MIFNINLQVSRTMKTRIVEYARLHMSVSELMIVGSDLLHDRWVRFIYYLIFFFRFIFCIYDSSRLLLLVFQIFIRLIIYFSLYTESVEIQQWYNCYHRPRDNDQLISEERTTKW